VVSKEAVAMVTDNVIREFADDGVHYLELRSTPRPLIGLPKRGYVEAVVSVIQQTSTQLGLPVKLILSIDRSQSVDEALDTVQIAAEYQQQTNGVVVGIDLSGNPNVMDSILDTIYCHFTVEYYAFWPKFCPQHFCVCRREMLLHSSLH
jgi:adenosine deaminase